jgi:hypothetical protein
MKHLKFHETFLALLILLLVGQMLFAFESAVAQGQENPLPIFSHRPIKVGYREKPLNVIVFVASDATIRGVRLVVNYAGQSLTGAIPERKELGQVPVIVRAVKDTRLYAGPGTSYKAKDFINVGEELRVTRLKGDFYGVLNSLNNPGYVEANTVEVVKSGAAYGVAIPPAMTAEPEITYQIQATDALGHENSTDFYTVRLLTEEQVAQLRSGKMLPAKEASAGEASQPRQVKQEKENKSFFASPWFWGTMAAIGGGAYYYSTLNEDKSKEEKATVNVTVGWK